MEIFDLLTDAESEKVSLINDLTDRIFGIEMPFYRDLMEDPEIHKISITQELTNLPKDIYYKAEIVTDYGVFSLSLGSTLIDELSNIALPGWHEEQQGSISQTVRVLYIFSRIFSVSGLFKKHVNILSVTEDKSIVLRPTPHNIVGCIRIGNLCSGFSLHLQKPDYARIKKAIYLNADKPTNRLVELDIPIDLSIAGPTLTLSEFGSVQPGDALLLQVGSPEQMPITCDLENYITIKGKLDDTGNILIESFRRVGSQLEQDESDIENSESSVIDSDFADLSTNQGDVDARNVSSMGDLANLPVKLSICFSPEKISLHKLSQLKLGSILVTSIDLTESIIIKANDRAVGKGALLRINDCVAVQVTHWQNSEQIDDD
ncbi:FliM/FliN family flagellar motor switch protein [Ruegeria sp. SCPT10]|uniref:FliM/FliN family flagellar motor switch protein n=1 Tax=Ruegeria sp. SCP10 TaxID=3141377 RepID=UPI00333CF946